MSTNALSRPARRRGRRLFRRERRLAAELLEARYLLSFSAGGLDPTFGDGGLVLTDVGDHTGEQADDVAAAAQADGKIVVAGSASHWSWSSRNDFAVARYNADGSLDTSFGEEGIVRIDFGNSYDYAHAVVLDSTGRIVVAGHSQQGYQHDFAVARLTSSGALDTSFDGDGKRLIDFAGASDVAKGVAIDSLGRIVLTGESDQDTGRGIDYDFAIARLDANGALDAAFDGDGMRTIDLGGDEYGYGVVVDASDRIVMVGASYQGAGVGWDADVLRLDANGAWDATFDGDGLQTIPFASFYSFAYDPVIDSSGRIVVAGRSSGGPTGNDFAVARLLASGALDVSFDGDGMQTVDFGGNEDFASTVAIDGQGRIVVVGATGLRGDDFAVARLDASGAPDASFDADGRQVVDFGSREQVGGGAIDSMDRVLIAGSTVQGGSQDFALARLDASGALDAAFDGDGLVTTDIGLDGTTDQGYDVAVQSDGKIVVAGSFRIHHSNSYEDFAVARYNPDGSLDASFGKDGIARIEFGHWPAVAQSVAIDSQGRIVVGGYARWSSSSNTDFAVTRLTPSGEVDTSFNPYGLSWHWWWTAGRAAIDFGGNDDYGYGVAVDADDNVVVVGRSGNDFAAARLRGDGPGSGELDYSFGVNGKKIIDFAGGYDVAQDVAIDASGRILLAGRSYQGPARGNDFAVARLDSTGALDLLFDSDGKQAVDFGDAYDGAEAVALDSDGRIVLAGWTSPMTWPANQDYAAARLLDSGQLDSSLDGDGRQSVDLGSAYERARAVAIDGAGAIILAGETSQSGTGADFGVAKLAPNGAPVSSFGDGGRVTTDFGLTSEGARGVAVDDQDRIVAVGWSNQWWPSYNDIAVARYLNAGPNLTSVAATSDPLAVGEPVSASAEFFYDPGKGDLHTAVWDWGDGDTSIGAVSASGGVGAVEGSHAYATAGLYTITVTVTDSLNESGAATLQYVVVYDPNAGFVTGGGWFDSPQGADVANPWLTDKANFGFVAKYTTDVTGPIGETQFRVGDLKFHSTDYQWLVVAGSTAQYQGSGTINREGDYGFMLTVRDGQISGGEDAIRIKIWDKADGLVVYDNQMGAAQGDDPATLLGGGSLVIHDGGEALHAAEVAPGAPVGASLTPTTLAPVVAQARFYWASQGIGAERLAAVDAIDVRVADLSSSVLGVASSSNLIWIDRDAAGYGWNVSSSGEGVSFPRGMDLVSVVTHEFGHKLGLQHGDEHPVMAATLVPGVRTLAASASLHERLFEQAYGHSLDLEGSLPSWNSPISAAGNSVSFDTLGPRAASREHLRDLRIHDKIFISLAADGRPSDDSWPSGILDEDDDAAQDLEELAEAAMNRMDQEGAADNIQQHVLAAKLDEILAQGA